MSSCINCGEKVETGARLYCSECLSIRRRKNMRKETLNKSQRNLEKKKELLTEYGIDCCCNCGLSVLTNPLVCFSFYEKGSGLKVSRLINKFKKNENKIREKMLQVKVLCSNCWRKDRQQKEGKVLDRKRYFVDYMGGVCIHCGIAHQKDNTGIFIFHHPENSTKEENISTLLSRILLPEETILKELSKCVLLCSNCHDIEHLRLIEEKRKEFFTELDQEYIKRAAKKYAEI